MLNESRWPFTPSRLRCLVVGHDDTFARGAVGYGVTTWGDPPTLTFDNVLVTTPTRR